MAEESIGCLLLHGFSGSPSEMIPLGEALGEEDWTVSIATLAGHGTSPRDLAQTRWHDWVASARDAYADLKRRCHQTALIGLSMGGALALYLAASEQPDAVVAISTPTRVRPLFANAARLASRLLPLAPVVFRLSPRDPDVRQYHSPYSRIPLGATKDLAELLAAAMAVLPALRVPLLVVQGRRDWVIPRGSGPQIMAAAAAAPAQLLWLPRSGHVATLDRDRFLLFAEVKRFLRTHLGDEAGQGRVGDGTAD